MLTIFTYPQTVKSALCSAARGGYRTVGITAVTCSDYLVGYQMKGAQTMVIEKKNMKDMSIYMEDVYGNKEGVFSAATKLLKRALVDRTI
jgi:hypothetical protein